MNEHQPRTAFLAIDAVAPEPELIALVAALLEADGLVILPTDTVYGIALLASSTASPQSLFESKQRAAEKSIPLLVGSHADLTRYGHAVPAYATALARQHWPGALTLVVQASEHVPPAFVAPDGSVALRMPNNALTLAVLKAVHAPLATSSANLSGKAPACSVSELDHQLLCAVSLVVDGGSLTGGTPSTVVSCLEGAPQVLRPGPVAI